MPRRVFTPTFACAPGHALHRAPLRRTATVLSLSLVACSAGVRDDARVERFDSAGVTIVRTSGADRELDWRFERILDLGGADAGPEAFVRIHGTAIGVDSTGRLYVLDAGESHVTVFDRDGTALRTFGRRGGGPGEFGFPTDLAVTRNGTIGVYDFARRGLLMFAADGSVLPARALPGALQRKFRLSGEMVIGVFRRTEAELDSMRHRLLVIGPADTLVLAARAAPPPQPVDLGCVQLLDPPIFADELAWDENTGTIAFAAGPDYAIEVRRGGEQRERWHRDLAPLAASPALAAQEIGGDSMRFGAASSRCAVPATEAAEQIGFLEFAPRVRELLVTPAGDVWARRRTDVPGEMRIDVFAADGAYTGTLPAGAPWPAAFRAEDEIVTVEQDSLDLRHIIVYRIARSPS